MTAGKDGGDQGNFEERARDLRYGVFESLVSRGDVLLQGHHQNDQIETFLLRAIRGSGPKGLASVPYQRLLGQGCLVRPLLPFGREMIEAYALHHALRWVTDESNVDIAMDRNFIRAEIVPQLQARWPSVVKTITRSAALCRESVELLDELADMDLAAVLRPSVWSSDMLDCVALLELSQARQANLLRYWVLRHRAPLPSEKRLQQVLATVIPARSDSVAMVTWSGWCCQKFSEGLFLYRSLGPVPLDWSCSWNGKRRLDVAGLGFLSAKMKAETLPLTVSFRQGGESMNVAGRGTRSVKRLMQEAGVPPWIRGVVPLVYLGDVLISVGGYYNSDEAEALFEELYFSFR
jgi:tRNA(Ile)-lysidine synthase